MDRMEAEDFSLFGLLGRSWQLDAPVVDLTFDNSDSAVAFALADGSVAIAKIKDREPASGRIRISAEDGRSSILPRTKPLPPITRFTVQDGTPVALTAYGKHGFVIGDASGALTSVTTGGERTPFAKPLNAAITTLDHAPATGDLACVTASHQVQLIRRGRREPEPLGHDSEIAALAFSPAGDQLAVAGGDRITLWQLSEKLKEIARLGPCRHPACLAWNQDRTKLALGQEQGGVTIWQLDDTGSITLADYPAPVRTLAWIADRDILATSGAFRVIAWPLNRLKTNGIHPTSLNTGKPSLAAVEAIASHPDRPLIAAGYENGMLIIAQIGEQDELVIKTEGDGPMSSVKWSHDAGSIAIGSRQGLAAIVELPPQIFK